MTGHTLPHKEGLNMTQWYCVFRFEMAVFRLEWPFFD